MPQLRKRREIRITNVTSKSFGYVTMDFARGDLVCRNLIVADERVPTNARLVHKTQWDNQEQMIFRCVENTKKVPYDQGSVELTECREVGTAELHFGSPLPAGSPIALVFDLGSDGLLNIEAQDLMSGRSVQARFKTDAIMALEDQSTSDRFIEEFEPEFQRWSPKSQAEQGNHQEKTALSVFLCHASDDKKSVRQIYLKLKSRGFRPWLDEENLLPGQNWRNVIEQELRDCGAVVVFLSSRAVNKSGFVQKEIKIALDVLDEKPEDTVYLLPVKIDRCDIPRRLSHLHAVELFEGRGFEKVVEALNSRAAQLAREY